MNRNNYYVNFILPQPLGPLITILFLYLVLALSYSLTVPVFEAPDEPAHFLYAKDLATGKGLPVLDYSKSPREYHQPPLYYWLVAGALRCFDTDGYEQFTVRNPHAAISDASTFGNKNVYLHDPEREGWPFKGLSLAVHVARLISIGLGMLTIWATYGLALKLFSAPSPPHGLREHRAAPGKGADAPQAGIAAAAAAVVAFNPQFLFISSALNNDNAVTALCSLALWATATYYERPRSVRWLVALGGLSGLAILTKTTGLAVIALVLGVLAAKAIRQRLTGMLWLDAGIVILLAALIGGWWYARNALLYADPFLSSYINHWLSDEAAPRTAIEILYRFEQGEVSFWGTFGWLNITWDEWVYTLLRTWTRLCGLGLLVLGARWLIHKWSLLGTGKRTHMAIPPLVITFVWTGSVAALLIQWILVSGGLQGRLLFPAVSALAALLIAGWTSLVPRRWELIAAAIPIVGLVALAIATPFVTIAPAYARPTLLPSTDLPLDATSVDLTYAERVKLIGYHVSPSVAHPEDRVDVTLYWQALDSIPSDLSIFVHLFGHNRQRIGTIDTYPGLGNFPTSQWEAGQVIRDTYPIRIAPDAAAPTLATISVGWYDFHGSRDGIHALDPSGQPTTTAGVFKLIPKVWPEPEPMYELNTNFNNAITLLGYDIQLEADTGEGLSTKGDLRTDITLYWRCDAPLSADYTTFVHVRDTSGQVTGQSGAIVAQMDRPPADGAYPTSVWDPGEVIRDTVRVSVPSQAPPGKYEIIVGLYDSGTGSRLPVLDSHGEAGGDHIRLEKGITVPVK